MSSGSYDLGRDLFDYFPSIQERVRWIIGARDLADARKKLAEYTVEGRAAKIECPMLIGYSKDDRIMDPAGALKLYQAAVNSKREMVEGTGHAQAANAGGPRGDASAGVPGLGNETVGEGLSQLLGRSSRGVGFGERALREKSSGPSFRTQ